MVGYTEVQPSTCHRYVLRALEQTRGAFIAQRPADTASSVYYSIVGLDYEIGKAR
jgi:hypothetical protein